MRGSIWVAQAYLNGELVHLGYHGSELAAARAYDNWAKDFSHMPLNFHEYLSTDCSSKHGMTSSNPTEVLDTSKANTFASINDFANIDETPVDFSDTSDGIQGSLL